MLISLKHRFTFFCTPKCASNSIEAMLKPHCEIHLLGSPQVRHTNARQYASHVQPYLAEVAPETGFERIAIIREPVAWLHSWYRFRARSALRGGDNQNSTAHVSFAGFVDAYLAETRPPFAEVGSQLEFLLGEDGTLGVDRLFAYEQLDQLVAYFAARTGQAMSLHAINVSPTKVYRSNLLERLGALARRVRGQVRSGGAGNSRDAAPDSRAELSADQIRRLERQVALDMDLHATALRGPLHRTEWDGRHSGENDLPVS
jgi:hypothetical protein